MNGSILLLALNTSQIKNIIGIVLVGGMALVIVSGFVASKMKNDIIQDRILTFIVVPYFVCFIFGFLVFVALSIYDVFVAKPTPINLVYRTGIFTFGGLLVGVLLLILCGIGIEKIQNVTLKRILGAASSILGAVIFILYLVDNGTEAISSLYDTFTAFPILALSISAVVLVCIVRLIGFLVKLYRESEKDERKR